MGTVPWSEVVGAAPGLAALIRRRFEDHRLALIATLHADGAPRISGIEVFFDDRIWLGMMQDSLKAKNLLRDPRCALHNATIDPEVTAGYKRVERR